MRVKEKRKKKQNSRPELQHTSLIQNGVDGSKEEVGNNGNTALQRDVRILCHGAMSYSFVRILANELCFCRLFYSSVTFIICHARQFLNQPEIPCELRLPRRQQRSLFAFWVCPAIAS
mgnify:CR=1 FL=1